MAAFECVLARAAGCCRWGASSAPCRFWCTIPASCFGAAPTLFFLPLASPAPRAAPIGSRYAVAAFECVLARAAGCCRWCPGSARVQDSPAPRSIHSARARASLTRVCITRVLLGARSRYIEFLHRFARTMSIFRVFGIDWNCLRYFNIHPLALKRGNMQIAYTEIN